NGVWVDDGTAPTYVCRGKDGNNGQRGDRGDNGAAGQNGQHGRGVRRATIPPSDPQYALAGCEQGAATALYIQQIVNGLWVDDGTTPTYVCRGKDGATGRTYGWHKKFDSAPISSVSTAVLSQVTTGANSYMVEAKLNAPFSRGQ